MSAKLIVHRFGEEDELQILHINIVENDNLSEIKIGEWHFAKNDTKTKVKDKSRLIVKVVSDEISSILDLDSCAEKFEEIDNSENNLQQPIVECQCEVKHQSNDLFYNNKDDILKRVKTEHIDAVEKKENFYNDDVSYLKNPLEYSLEKVKENNAKIMENIHILNKTLTYTKNKEILGFYNPRTFRSYPCEECGKCFVYQTGLRRHYTVRHASLDTQQRWQFVWTCTECFQVWPRKDLALDHANQCSKRDNVDCVQEIKASSVLQCEFCEKVFTNIPRLHKHLKLHTVKRNYECNPCDLTFSCYKLAEQHWLSCLWLKMYYQFSLPKLLLCNACDRKFRNYDQLYNHRYKVEHFIPKLSQNEEGSFLPTLVYQCETCGQWFNVITQIQDHRHNFHPHFNNGSLYNNDVHGISKT